MIVGRQIPADALAPRVTRRDGIELRDWKPAHRALSAEHREIARRYITAILDRDPSLGRRAAAERQAYADILWIRFRDVYDDLHHAEHEDFMRAISRV